MTTGLDLINDALRSIKAIGIDETAEAGVSAVSLRSLNRMLGSWSAGVHAIYTEGKIAHALTGGQGIYTIGTAGGEDINSARPVAITAANVNNGNRDYPLEIIGERRYNEISRKDASGYLPGFLYYDANMPTAKIYLWCYPSSSLTLNLYVRQPLSDLDYNTTLTLPPGYEEAIVYNLGKRLAPGFNLETDMDYNELAQEGLDIIERANTMNDLRTARCESALLSGENGFDIESGF